MVKEAVWAERLLADGARVYLMEHRSGVTLYKVQRWVQVDARTFGGDVPTYHVWKNDKQVCSTVNYLEAYNAWDREASE